MTATTAVKSVLQEMPHGAVVYEKYVKGASDTVIIFDWDDTLCASTWVGKSGFRPKYCNEVPDIPDHARAKLQSLEAVVLKLLKKALEFGQVVIVTAAEQGWVELSASLFMPSCVELLNDAVKVVSARTIYEEFHPNSPKHWKIEAFRHEVFGKNAPGMLPRHVVSVGDGSSEREALLHVANMKNVLGKSMKFIAYPCVDEVRQQVELVHGCFDDICNYRGPLDLELSKEAAKSSIQIS